MEKNTIILGEVRLKKWSYGCISYSTECATLTVTPILGCTIFNVIYKDKTYAFDLKETSDGFRVATTEGKIYFEYEGLKSIKERMEANLGVSPKNQAA